MKITSAAVTILASIMALAPSAAAASADSRRPGEDKPDREKLRRKTVGMSVPLSLDYKAMDDGSKSVSMSYGTFDGLESELHQGSKSSKSKSSKAGQSCIPLSVTILTDYFPGGSSWRLTDQCSGLEVSVPEGYYTQRFTSTTIEICGPPAQYDFIIGDRSSIQDSCADFDDLTLIYSKSFLFPP